MGGGVKPVGWSERMARREADDERLVQEYADNGGRGRDRREVQRARDFVQHVRRDIGPNGVITKVEVHPNKVVAVYHMEPDPAEGPVAVPASALTSALTSAAQLTSSWPGGQPSGTDTGRPLGTHGRRTVGVEVTREG